MSADNGIYLTQWDDGWRVAYAQAIDDIDSYRPGSPCWNWTNRKYFEKSPVFKTEDEAWKYAETMEEKYSFLEYGVCGPLPEEGSRGPFPREEDCHQPYLTDEHGYFYNRNCTCCL